MNLARRVGQLLMVDCPSSGVAASTITSIRRYHAGSVILDGNSTLGVDRTRAITRQLQSLAPAGVRLFVSTDQEGGLVQRMNGQGFSEIPSAVVQGTYTASRLQSSWQGWAGELRSAGINVNLAPVLDTVPPGNRSNPPIGDLDREYGRTPTSVATHGVAVAEALDAAGVGATVKHFPGLGRVSGNTDVASGVTDHVTTRHDPDLLPFKAAVKEHVPFVMVSTAIYARIDPGTPAIFSRTIVTDMLRNDLGFKGVIITDDIGGAKQVASVPAGLRAVKFIAAGGTMALTVAPSTVPLMANRLIDRAQRDPAFRRQVNAAALVVLRAKAAAGLLP
jgi:beta-N-acetylhexosaminidase